MLTHETKEEVLDRLGGSKEDSGVCELLGQQPPLHLCSPPQRQRVSLTGRARRTGSLGAGIWLKPNSLKERLTRDRVRGQAERY